MCQFDHAVHANSCKEYSSFYSWLNLSILAAERDYQVHELINFKHLQRLGIIFYGFFLYLYLIVGYYCVGHFS